MKISLVSTWRIVNALGGAEKIFCHLANALVNRGHEVTTICFDFAKGKPAFPLDKRVKFVNAGQGRKPDFFHTRFAINIRSLSLNSSKRRNKRVLFRENFIGRYLIPAIRESSPDVIIAFQPESVHLIRCFAKLEIPVIAMSHNATDIFLPNNQPPCIRESLQETAAIQVLMPRYVDEVKRILPQANVVHIPNPVPQTEKIANRSAHTIINCGRIVYQKHQELLVEAFSLIANQYPDWNVKIFGGSSEDSKRAKNLQQLINSRGLSERVLLCGPTKDVFSELEKASIFAFPSRHEGFSLSLTEAMTMGLPAVGCKTCPSVNELIRDGANGYLCDDTPMAFARGLSRLMESELLRTQFGNTAKKDMQSYAPDVIWDMWERLLDSVARKK